MQASSFQFSNPELIKLDFFINEDFSENKDHVDMPISMQVAIQELEEGQCDSGVILTMDIGEKSDKFPFFISIKMRSVFSWEEGKFTKEQIERLLNKNAPALLLGYMRPFVAMITNSSPYAAYNVPFLDFSKIKTNED